MTQLSYSHPAWIEIDLQQFKRNIAAIQRHIGRSKLCLPIKANAYGHGLIPIANAAVQAGVDYLAVSCLQEGALLRESGISIPILVMGAIHEEQIIDLIQHKLEFTISSQFKAELVAKKCIASQKKARVHIEIDTGMQRTGVRTSTAVNLLNYLESMKCFEVAGVYSHFATADTPGNEFAKEQIREFKTFVNQHIIPKNNNILCHLANSNGVCYFPESYLDMVRPGIMVFGYFANQMNPQLQEIAPFFSVKAKISYFKVVSEGQGIGYGHTYKAKENTRIVTVPIGYGDGYRYSLSNRGEVLIGGKRYRIAGTICMDQFMVDIGHDAAYVGDEVVLIGKQGEAQISLNEVSTLCNTIPYEILCAFNDRLPRLYRE